MVVGANGSGKTRLGVWIEFDSAQKDRVLRISAQKSLSMPQTVAAPSVEKAREHLIIGQDLKLYFGRDTWPEDVAPLKFQAKWNGRPSTHLSDDFGYLLEYLFAEEQDVSTKYRQEAGRTEDRIEPPKTKLDRIKRVWEEVLPHRRLEISGSKIDASPSDNPSAVYAPTDMSDGERVIFYLIGQALSAPEGGIVLIDEPELHLHRSIQATLWDKIEAERPDCLFVYLTHDLDFAASRVAATRVCLKGYDGQQWQWFEVPENEDLPEETLLEILGSRKPIIFVEGEGAVRKAEEIPRGIVEQHRVSAPVLVTVVPLPLVHVSDLVGTALGLGHPSGGRPRDELRLPGVFGSLLADTAELLHGRQDSAGTALTLP